MRALQFEAVKIALKQDRSGYVLTLNLHPDEIPDELLRDFVGSRYGVAMVRINDDETPVIYCISFPTNILELLFEIICGIADIPFCIILTIVPKDELMLDDNGDAVPIGVSFVSVTLILADVFDLKLKEPVPFPKILNIAA